MPDQCDPPDSVGILVPSGMLGAGFSPDTVTRGLSLGADVIAVDGGSTDSGPYYLGAGVAKTTEGAVRRDLRLLLAAASSARIPLVVGSCGTSGTDSGVNWVAGIVNAICRDDGLDLAVAKIFSEQRAERLIAQLERGRVHALPPSEPLDAATLDRCVHIVGMMGHEPIEQALRAGADVVLAGRATDTALIAAVPLQRGLPAGPVWHAAKISECGGLCTTGPRSGGVLVTLDQHGFTIEPLGDGARCTPASVAAHMMYENADPFRMREPAGTLDTSTATYRPLDHRRVRVEGARFEPAAQYTVKLEGAAPAGYQTMIVTGIRDPELLRRLDEWCDQLLGHLRQAIPATFALSPADFDLQIRRYGHDAVLGAAEPCRDQPPREVGIVFIVTAADQATATQLAKFANPLLLHAPLAGESALPSYALLGSPPETERGQVHEFVLQHAVDVSKPGDLIRTRIDRIGR
jgi:Acyclic terpene utilisation family protein AtuA